jgi:hypothetical protein
MTEAQMHHSMAQIDGLEAEMKSGGALVLSARLTEPDTATVVRMSEGAILTTDGPFVESKEHLGGFYLIEVDDLDAALAWASKTTAIIGMPIEVRALWGSRGEHERGALRVTGEAEIGRVFREVSGRSLAPLIRVLGQIDLAEDAVQEASGSPGCLSP